MRISLLLAGLTAAALTALPAAAQEAGRYEAPLRKMLTEAAQGRCAPDVMGDALLAACNQQLPTMAAGLASLGEIASATFVRAEEIEGARYEVWRLQFTGGQTMLWRIGDVKDGRFQTAGTTEG